MSMGVGVRLGLRELLAAEGGILDVYKRWPDV